MVGDHVLFHGKEYVIIFRYISDYCELKEKGNKHHIELVHISEIVFYMGLFIKKIEPIQKALKKRRLSDNSL